MEKAHKEGRDSMLRGIQETGSRFGRGLVRHILIVTLTSTAFTGFANGFRLPNQDAEATAKGEAFAATADNPSAVYYNPAGITQLSGHNVRAGVYALSFITTYESPLGEERDTKDAIHPIPQFYYTYTPKTFPLAFGLGVYAPFGLGLEWPQDTGFRSRALKSDLLYMTINPVVAWRVTTNLSVAIGPTFNYSDADLRQGVTPYPNNDVFRFKGDAVDYGFRVGVLWKPNPKVSFGAAYRSQTVMNYEGYTETSFVIPPPGYPSYLKLDASAEFPFPQGFVVGISYRPTPKWNLEFNADWTEWSRLKTVTIQQALPQQIVLNWDSSFLYEFGVTRDLGKGWRLSAGYVFNENSIPDSTFWPLVPDLDRHFGSVGIGYRGDHFNWAAGYQFSYGPWRTVRGSDSVVVDGRYKSLSHALSVSVGWHF